MMLRHDEKSGCGLQRANYGVGAVEVKLPATPSTMPNPCSVMCMLRAIDDASVNGGLL